MRVFGKLEGLKPRAKDEAGGSTEHSRGAQSKQRKKEGGDIHWRTLRFWNFLFGDVDFD